MTPWLTIGIAGVTCGGKSTLAHSLYTLFSDKQHSNILHKNIKINEVRMINQDEYFHPVDHPNHTWIEKLNHINWEIITSLDVDKMCDDIRTILGCGRTYYERNSLLTAFETSNIVDQSDDFASAHPIETNVLIIEGFLLFNNPVSDDLCDIKFHLHLPYEKCWERRQKRVYIPADVTGYFETCVWPYYEKHFKEVKDCTNIVKLNGALTRDKILNFVVKYIQSICEQFVEK